MEGALGLVSRWEQKEVIVEITGEVCGLLRGGAPRGVTAHLDEAPLESIP